MTILSDQGYESEMKTKVLPVLKERRLAGKFERTPGQKLYYEHFYTDREKPKAVVVMVHGFSEAIPKFYEAAWYFLENGYDVWMLQQREHGISYRSTRDRALIYVRDYNDLIEDLHFFVQNVVRLDSKHGCLPCYLFAHSMGGGVGANVLERHPSDFAKAVLTAPMLEMYAGGKPVWAVAAFARVLCLLGKGKEYLPGAQPYTGVRDFENSCSTCSERYEYWCDVQDRHPEYQMCVSSIRTALEFLKLTRSAVKPGNVSKVTAKVLLLQAGRDNMVSPGGQEKFIKRLGAKGQLIRFAAGKHELYRGRQEELSPYWEEIFEFLERE